MRDKLRIRGIGGTLVAFAVLSAGCSAATTPSPTASASGAASISPASVAPSSAPSNALDGTTVTIWTMEDAAKFEALI